MGMRVPVRGWWRVSLTPDIEIGLGQLPDLKAVSVEDGSSLVNVVLQLGQKVVVAPTEAPDR